jgi:predicted GIY-YIG superfamily endonuclease
MQPWYLYILSCADNTFYTGITCDLSRRLEEHNAGRASKYTRCRRPVTQVFTKQFPDRSAASKAEYRTKQLPRAQKQKLIDGDLRWDDMETKRGTKE